MGRKIPIGIQDFEELRKNGYVYIDKTKEILELVNSNKYYFFPRPRRFGKSLLCSTMKYMFLGEKKLFKGLYAESNWDWDDWYPVVYIDFAAWNEKDSIAEFVFKYGEIVIREKDSIELKKFEDYLPREEFTRLSDIIIKLNEQYNKQVAVLIDEYDRPVLNLLHKPTEAEQLREKFRNFYSGIKTVDNRIRLFFLTGITKILKMSIFSVLNNLQDLFYDITAYKLVGYTESEIKKYFNQELAEAAKYNAMEEKELYQTMRKYYNGYNFGNPQDRVYNPWDINNFMLKKMFGMYWSSTGLPSSVESYIREKGVDIEEIIERLYSNELIVNEVDLNLEDLKTISAEVLFLTSGYLTVKEKQEDVFICEFPNVQVEKVVTLYFTRLAVGNGATKRLQLISRKLLKGLKELNKELIKQSIEEILKYTQDVSYEWYARNPEGWIKTLIMLVLNLTVDRSVGEKHFVYGRKDIEVEINDKKYVLEVKVNRGLEELKKDMEKYKEYADVVIGILWNRGDKSQTILVEIS